MHTVSGDMSGVKMERKSRTRNKCRKEKIWMKKI